MNLSWPPAGRVPPLATNYRYQRLVPSGVLSATQQEGLDRLFHRLNPVALRARIDADLAALWPLAEPSAGALRLDRRRLPAAPIVRGVR